MNSTVFRSFVRVATCGTSLAAVALFSAPMSRAQASAVPNAPTVAPAPAVDKPLPPAANDTPGEQPTAQHVWVAGHWRWNEGAYVWESGRWEIPPMPNVSWVPPQWQQQGSGYVLKEGYWDEAQPAASATAPQPAAEVATTEPPPPPQREVIYERPSPVHVWISGYWGWRGGRHVWIGGHWEMPPRANALWVAPRWEFRGGRYVFVEGYWRDSAIVSSPPPAPPQVVVAPPQQQVVVVAPPPPPRQEIVYARPGPGYVWISGYWAWHGGRHVWIAGHWELPPRGYRSWNEPRWERRGGSYVFIEGHWGR
ncbi:MAG TPA: hypothetical protein VHD62_18150 [Opitutaceae bacterium]|nr:hypothetical protein [Opitutaceae bacterium]